MVGQVTAPDLSHLGQLLDELNRELVASGVTPFKLALVDPREILPSPKNARYMPKRTFDQLVANIRQDGNLAGHYPLCWQREDGRFVILSGNHRVAATVEAGIPLIIITYTDRAMLEDEQVARQLAHNALSGMDNPVTLKELWESIQAVEFKVFTGIDESQLAKLVPSDVVQVDSAGLVFEQVVLLFLPREATHIEALVRKLAKYDRALQLAAPYQDWDRFFGVLLKFKEDQRILNSATALRVMCELVEEWFSERGSANTEEADGKENGKGI